MTYHILRYKWIFLASLTLFGAVLFFFVNHILHKTVDHDFFIKILQQRLGGHDPKVYTNKETNVSGFEVGTVKLEYHPTFKNPCFLEHVNYTVGSVYSTNRFITVQNYWGRHSLGYKLQGLLKSHRHGVLLNISALPGTTPSTFRLRCLPYFLVIGAAKSGTTDLAKKLIAHPRILGAVTKEPIFWSHFRFTIDATLGDYCDLFDDSVLTMVQGRREHHEEKYILGEFSTQTLGDEVFWRRHPRNRGLREPLHLNIDDIYHVNPDVKLIVLLRNPTAKLYSSYNMYRRGLNPTPKDFNARVLKSIEWWRNCTNILGLPVRTCAYSCVPEMPPILCDIRAGDNNRWPGKAAHYSGEILRALYSVFVRDWLSVFPRNQMLFLRTEDCYNMSKVINNEVVAFLGVQQESKDKAPNMYAREKLNTRSYQRMLPETKMVLDNFFGPFKSELSQLLGDKKWLWEDVP